MKVQYKKFLSFGLLASVLILFAGCGKTDDTSSTAGGSASVTSVNPYTGPFTCFGGVADVTPNGLTRCTTDVVPNNAQVLSLGNNGAFPSASGFPGVYGANTISASGSGSVSTNQPLTDSISVMSGDWISFQAVPGSYFQQLNSGFFDSCSNDGNTTYDISGGILAGYGYQPVTANPDTNPNNLSSILSQPVSGCIGTCLLSAQTDKTNCLALAVTSADVLACNNAYTSAAATCNANQIAETKSCLTPAPSGFIAAIGSQIYALGTSFNSSVNVASGTGATMGTLSAGLNKTPWSNFCANVQVVYFKHQHCVDSSGNPAVCPNPRTSGDPSLSYP